MKHKVIPYSTSAWRNSYTTEIYWYGWHLWFVNVNLYKRKNWIV